MKYIYIWVFSIIALMLFSALAFLLINIYQDIYSNGWQAFTEKTSFPAKIAALATLAIAILTTILAWETRQLRDTHNNQIKQIRKNGMKPDVSLYLKSNPASFHIIDIHIINNGLGVAQNVKFKFTNESEKVQNVYNYLEERINEISILKNGISSLAVGEERACLFFDFLSVCQISNEYESEIGQQVIKIDIEFEDIEDTKYSSKSYFDLTEYKGFAKMEATDPLYIISKSLEKIQTEIGHFATGHKRLSTNVYNSADRDEERKLLEQRWAEQQKQEKKDSKESDTDD